MLRILPSGAVGEKVAFTLGRQRSNSWDCVRSLQLQG